MVVVDLDSTGVMDAMASMGATASTAYLASTVSKDEMAAMVVMDDWASKDVTASLVDPVELEWMALPVLVLAPLELAQPVALARVEAAQELAPARMGSESDQPELAPAQMELE